VLEESTCVSAWGAKHVYVSVCVCVSVGMRGPGEKGEKDKETPLEAFININKQ